MRSLANKHLALAMKCSTSSISVRITVFRWSKHDSSVLIVIDLRTNAGFAVVSCNLCIFIDFLDSKLQTCKNAKNQGRCDISSLNNYRFTFTKECANKDVVINKQTNYIPLHQH